MVNMTMSTKYRLYSWREIDQDLADAMKVLVSEDECNDTYGRIRMYQVLLLKQPEGVHIK